VPVDLDDAAVTRAIAAGDRRFPGELRSRDEHADSFEHALGAAGERFLGSGNERTIVQMPAGYGYFIPPSPSLYMNVHIHNESTSSKTVAVRLKFTWQPASDNLKPVKPIWLDVEYGVPPARLGENCGNSQYRTGAGCPASCYDDDHWSWTVPGPNWPGTSTPFEGTIVGLGGHVHNYGISVAATNNGVGICTSYAGYGFWDGATYEGSRYYPGPGSGADADHPASADQPEIIHEWHQPTGIAPDNKYHIQKMSVCGAPPYPHNVINPGHTLTVHSQYNTDGPNPGDAAGGHQIDDVMGIVQTYVADNCVGVSNPNQEDGDGDGTGDACDPDVMDSDADSWTQTRTESSGACPTAGAQPTFRDCIETFVGTSPTDGCANSATANDEADKHPADANDDTLVNVTDRTLMVLAVKAWAGGAGAYNARYDLNASNSLNVTDRSMLVLYLKASGGAPCTP